jgi:hypothetical protein
LDNPVNNACQQRAGNEGNDLSDSLRCTHLGACTEPGGEQGQQSTWLSIGSASRRSEQLQLDAAAVKV